MRDNCRISIRSADEHSPDAEASYPLMVNGFEDLERGLREALFDWKSKRLTHDLLREGGVITIEIGK